MINTIKIISESEQTSLKYRAICGEQETIGLTPGQALDQMESSLKTQGNEIIGDTLVILQRFQSDELFPSQKQQKLKSLMTEFQQTLANEVEFSAEKKQQLESLAEAELEAAIKRGEMMIKQIQDNS